MGNFWGLVGNGAVPEPARRVPAPGPVPPVPLVVVPEPAPPVPLVVVPEPIPAAPPRRRVLPAPKRIPKKPQGTVVLKILKSGAWNLKVVQSTPSFTAAVAEAVVDVIENPDGRFLPSNTLGEVKRFKQHMLQSGWKCVQCPDDLMAKNCLGRPRPVRFENTQIATKVERQIGMSRHVYRCLYGVWPPRAEDHDHDDPVSP